MLPTTIALITFFLTCFVYYIYSLVMGESSWLT